jgi:hypothetical protein
VNAANEAMLEIAVKATTDGHDLGVFDQVGGVDRRPNGWQTKCRVCGRTAWIGAGGVNYSLLRDICGR